MTRPFNVLKLAPAEIGSLQAEPAAWLRYGSSERQIAPGLGISRRLTSWTAGLTGGRQP